MSVEEMIKMIRDHLADEAANSPTLLALLALLATALVVALAVGPACRARKSSSAPNGRPSGWDRWTNLQEAKRQVEETRSALRRAESENRILKKVLRGFVYNETNEGYSGDEE